MSYLKNIGVGIFIIIGVSFTSCQDFLDEDLTTKYSTDYFNTEQGLVDLTTSYMVISVGILVMNMHMV